MTCVLGYSNQIDTATLSGGSWNASYPLTNLQNRYLSQKARTANALSASSVINLDLASAQSIGVVALISHNFSAAATVRIQGSSAADQSVALYDSTAETIYSGTDYAKSFTAVSARYWRISISDTGNSSGYVQLGRVFIGWRFSPTNNIDWNPTLAVESKTAILESLGGPEYFDERPNRRLFTGQWSWLSDPEAYNVLLAIQRSHDVSREIYLIQDDTDINYRGTTNFLARFRQLSPVEWPYLGQHTCGVELGELV